MSVENVSYEMANGSFPLPSTSAVANVIANVEDATYGKLAILVISQQAISLAAAGAGLYAPGCIAVDLSSASGGNSDASAAVNKGSAASPSWTVIT